MNPRIGIVAALAGEIAPLVRSAGLRKVVSGQLSVFESNRFVVAYAGMGRARVLEACAAVAERGPLALLVSAGWVGSLNPEIKAASVHQPVVVIDAASGERFGVPAPPRAIPAKREQELPPVVLVTTSSVANLAQKRELATRWHADLVDMEAAHVARFGREYDIPFACIRAVSDVHDQSLPDFDRFTLNGQFQTQTFVRWVLLRPQWWPGLLRMGRNSAAAAKAMCAEIQRLLVEAKQ